MRITNRALSLGIVSFLFWGCGGFSSIRAGAPDSAIAGEIEHRDLDFTLSTDTLEMLRHMRAGPATLQAIDLNTPAISRPVPITGNNAAQLKLKVLARIRGNAYQIDSTADTHTVSVLPVGVDRGVILIDMDTGIETARCTANYSSYAISGSGRIVAGAVGGEVQLCDPLSPTVVRSLQPVAGEVTSLAFSADGRFLASGGSDGRVRIWNVAKGGLVWTSPVDHTPIAKVALSPEGNKLAAAYLNLSVKYWDLGANTSRQAPLPAATGNSAKYYDVRALSFLAAGRRLLVGLKGVTWLWDVASEGGAVRQLAHAADAVSPDERIVVSVGEYVGLGAQGYTPLTLWDLSSGAEIATVNTARGMLAVSATFTKDGSALLASTIAGEILVWRPSVQGNLLSSAPGSTLTQGSCSQAIDLGYSLRVDGQSYKVTGIGPFGPNRTHIFYDESGIIVQGQSRSTILQKLAFGAWTKEFIVDRYTPQNGSAQVKAFQATYANIQGWQEATDLLARTTVESLAAVVTAGETVESLPTRLTIGEVERQLADPKVALARWVRAGLSQSLTDYGEMEDILTTKLNRSNLEVSDLERIAALYAQANTLASVHEALGAAIAPSTWQDVFAQYLKSAVSELPIKANTFLTLKDVLNLEQLVATSGQTFDAYKRSLGLALRLYQSNEQVIASWTTAATRGCILSVPDGNRGLPAPRLISPTNGAVFNDFPRTLTLKWEAVPDATGYVVEVDFYDPQGLPGAGLKPGWVSERDSHIYIQQSVSATSFPFDFVGAQPGRWRVWAIDMNGQEGSKSDWCVFRFTR